MPERDPVTGRFVNGNGGGPGRPPREREQKYYEITMTTCTFQEWQDVVQKAVAQAKRGDAVARKWLSDYLVGVPEIPVSSEVTILGLAEALERAYGNGKP